MDKHDDELLSSYLDGELATAEAQKLEQRLARDGELQQRLDAMRGADDAARRLYAAVAEAPLPASVLQLLAADKSAHSNVISFPQRGLRQFWQMPVAIAASVALAVGFMVNQLAQRTPAATTSFATLSARSINPGSDLYDLLNGEASGQVVVLAGDTRGKALLTFIDQSGRYCRQLRLDTEVAAAQAVACRDGSAWQIEVVAFADAAPEGQFQTASSSTPTSISSAVDGLIGPREPLDSEQEKQAISKSWEK